jgi:hypothetical protein
LLTLASAFASATPKPSASPCSELFGVHAGAGAAGAAPAPCRFCDGATAQLPAVRCSIEFENQVRARAEDAFKDYDEARALHCCSSCMRIGKA